MSASRRHEAEELFQHAADLPSEQRAAYLDQRGASDPAVRTEVERLLARLETSAIASLAAVERLDELDRDLVGDHVGPYKLLQLIGEGGFGAVYMAEQQEPVHRKVALKIIKLGMDTKQVIARFEAERQALALMEHPNIARVFDAGATEAGRPYFVMELVRGIPITEYCDENGLSTRERIELFTQVCRAVQHAHQKGVIHRDIKPSNVLVTLHDGTPVPKVIDFGIAKATSERLTEKTLFTEFLQFVGTPQYMSPEQAAMSGLDVDTRTDVYSLGVLLHELLTGTTPFDAVALRKAAFGEVQRIIQEEEPPTPSQRVSTLGSRLPEIARARRAEPQALRRLIRGDLDWIVMRALEKDRTRRYETATSLAEDVDRHLHDEPVLAGPPALTYKLRKFVRRNRIAVASGALVTAALLIGLAAAGIGFVRARAEAESAKAINAFFNEMLVSADPMQLRLLSAYAHEAPILFGRTGGFARDVSVAEMARGASAQIDKVFEGKPELAATARESIGMTLRGLGQYAEAEPQLRAALDIRRRVLGDDHPETLRTMLALGDLLFEAGQSEVGESFVQSAYEGMSRAFGAEHQKTLSCAGILAAVLSDRRRFDEAESVFERTLETQRRVLGREHRDTLATMWKWSVSCLLQGKYAEGETLARELYDISRQTLSPNDSLNILSKPLMGWWYVARYQYDQAEAILRPGLAQSRRILGEQHPFTYMTMQCLARALQGSELQEEKEQLYRQALAGLRATRGELHWQTLSSTIGLARWLDQRGSFGEAEQLWRKLVADYARVYGREHGNTLGNMSTLASFLERVGKLDEAIAVRRERLAVIRQRYGSPESVVLHNELKQLAALLLRTGRVVEGRRVTQELVDLVREAAAARPDDANMLNSCAWALLTCSPASSSAAVQRASSASG